MPSNIERHDPCVYFLRDMRSGHIKIGTTTRLRSRLSQIRSEQGGRGYSRLQVLGVLPGGVDLERPLHRLFAEYYTNRGEWFKPGQSLLWFIAARTMQLDASGELPACFPVTKESFSIFSVKMNEKLRRQVKAAAARSFLTMEGFIHETLCDRLGLDPQSIEPIANPPKIAC